MTLGSISLLSVLLRAYPKTSSVIPEIFYRESISTSTQWIPAQRHAGMTTGGIWCELLNITDNRQHPLIRAAQQPGFSVTH